MDGWWSHGRGKIGIFGALTTPIEKTKIHRVCGWFAEVPNLQISPKKSLVPNLEYKSGSMWIIRHVTEDTLKQYVWTWWIPCKLAATRKPIWWHFHVEMSQGIVAPLVPCPSNLSFNRWPMFCVRGNPLPPWGGCLDTVLPVIILPRGPPDEFHFSRRINTGPYEDEP